MWPLSIPSMSLRASKGTPLDNSSVAYDKVTEFESPKDSVDCRPRLGTTYEAPIWARQPFVLSGYRLFYDVTTCLKSVCWIHNETINIWTHLLPAIWFTVCVYNALVEWKNGSFPTLFALAKIFYPLCASFTLYSSAAFHTCNCANQHVHKTMKTVDFVGISGLILGTTWPVMHYTFRCEPTAWTIYAFVFSLLSILALAVPWFPIFHHDHLRLLRVGIYCLISVGPMFMALHAMIIFGIDAPILSTLYKYLLYSYLGYLGGIVFYASRVPERFFPGTFDIIGHSHQIWHCFVFLGAYAAYKGLLGHIASMTTLECTSI